MKASEARALVETRCDSNWAENLTKQVEESETPLEVLVNAGWDLLKVQIADRAQAGKTHIMTEPFVHIPGNLYTFEQSQVMAKKLAGILKENEYREVTWDHRDKRVVFQFKW